MEEQKKNDLFEKLVESSHISPVDPAPVKPTVKINYANDEEELVDFITSHEDFYFISCTFTATNDAGKSFIMTAINPRDGIEYLTNEGYTNIKLQDAKLRFRKAESYLKDRKTFINEFLSVIGPENANKMADAIFRENK